MADIGYSLNRSYQPPVKRYADLDGPDFYPTPEWATRALIDNETFAGEIWECACGDGAMSETLLRNGNQVYSSDLYDRGYGEANLDFLSSSRKTKNIITNPPYNSAEQFLHHALELADQKVALLLRLAFLESAKRCRSIFQVTPPTRVWVFSERITFYPNGIRTGGSGTTAYAWFVWDKTTSMNTELNWLPPGYKS